MAGVVVELSGDEAKLLRSMQKIIEQNSKVKDSFKNNKDESNKAVDSMISKIGGMAASYISVQAAVNLVSIAQQGMIDRQKEALQLAKDLASAQQEAAKNLAGNNPQAISDALLKTVPELAKKTNFSDLPKLTTALGSSASIVGEDAAKSAVEVSAILTRFKKDDLQSTSTSTADIMKAAQIDGRQAMALLLTAGAVARPEELPKLAGGASRAIYAGVDASPTQKAVDAAKDTAALFATFSKVDKKGESAATATIQMIDLLRETFNPTRDDRAKRDDRIAELLKEQAITTEEQVAIDRANLSIMQKQAIANRLSPTDMRPGAQDIRLDLAEAKASLVRAQKAATLNDKDTEELRRLQLQKQLAATDPGDLRGRMSAIQQSPELLRTAEANLKGEAAFKSIAQGFFDPNSIHMKGLNEALQNVTTDVKKFDEAVASMEITPQQQLAMAGEKVDTQVEINKMGNVGLAAREQIREIERKALKGTSVDYMSSMGSQDIPIISNFNRLTRDISGESQLAMDNLAGRRNYLNSSGNAGADELKLLVESMQQLVEISRQNGVRKDVIERQTAVMTETRNLLDERLKNGPDANAIRAQAAGAK